MYSFDPYQKPYGQYYSKGNQQSSYQHNGFGRPQLSSSPSASVTRQCNVINQRALHLSSDELTRILDELLKSVEKSRNDEQKFTNLADIVTVLIRVPRPVLASVVQHRFFTVLQTLLSQILQQWNRNSNFKDDEVVTLRNLIKLFKSFFHDAINVKSYPSWFTDHSLLESIALCVVDISQSERFFDKSNGRAAKQFIRLFDLYNDYQDLVYDDTTANQDQLVVFLDPVVQCLTSNFYFDALDNVARGATLRSRREKFFLSRCAIFLTSYNGKYLFFGRIEN